MKPCAPKSLLSAAILVLLAVSAGAGDGTPSGKLEAAVGGTAWKLVHMVREGTESTLAADAVPTITIEAGGKVHGLATLNRYFGQVEIGDSGHLAWSAPLGSTMMAGPEPLMDQETAFLQALQATRKISLREGRLVLEDDTGRTRLEFER